MASIVKCRARDRARESERRGGRESRGRRSDIHLEQVSGIKLDVAINRRRGKKKKWSRVHMRKIKSRKQETKLHRSELGPASAVCLTPAWRSSEGTRNLGWFQREPKIGWPTGQTPSSTPGYAFRHGRSSYTLEVCASPSETTQCPSRSMIHDPMTKRRREAASRSIWSATRYGATIPRDCVVRPPIRNRVHALECTAHKLVHPVAFIYLFINPQQCHDCAACTRIAKCFRITILKTREEGLLIDTFKLKCLIPISQKVLINVLEQQLWQQLNDMNWIRGSAALNVALR